MSTQTLELTRPVRYDFYEVLRDFIPATSPEPIVIDTLREKSQSLPPVGRCEMETSREPQSVNRTPQLAADALAQECVKTLVDSREAPRNIHVESISIVRKFLI